MHELSDRTVLAVPVLAGLARRIRAEFDPECIIRHEETRLPPVRQALRLAPSLTQPRTVSLKQGVLEDVFGSFGPGHAFNAVDLGIKLTEPQATRGLKQFLNHGKPELRAARIRAFLEALEVPDLPGDHALERARVFAERDRIDLEVEFPVTPRSRSFRLVIIEAKFGHHLTEGQLSKYRRDRLNDPRIVKPPVCRIVGLTRKAGKGLRGRQVHIWPVHLWRDVWLQFEKRRPNEPDGQLAVFMALLWRRIGGLTLNSH